jgi:hypothetical protein
MSLCLNVLQNLAASAADDEFDDDEIDNNDDIDEDNDDFDANYENRQLKKRKLKINSQNELVNVDGSNLELINYSWLSNKKELKSNIELTKCLKYMQPLLEEALLKKHTSRSWKSVQGPMTWQHFCRISFRDNSSTSLPINCYEPEPIPSLLVSSSDRDWLCVSPYAIKFWD